MSIGYRDESTLRLCSVHGRRKGYEQAREAVPSLGLEFVGAGL
jgi:hypothetical protein